MRVRLFAIMLTGWLLLAAGPPAHAQPACTYQRTGSAPAGTGLLLERGQLSCLVAGATLTSATSALRVDMKTPGRFVAATPPPLVPPKPDDNPNHYVGSVFALELPTAWLQSMAHLPIQPYGPAGQAAINANLFTNSPWYSRRNKNWKTAATWLRGLLIAHGQVYNPVRGNPDNPCEASATNSCFPFPFDATFLVDSASHAAIEQIDAAGSVPAGTVTAVTGSHRLVASGRNVAPSCPGDSCVGEFYGPNSRTALGLTQGNTTLLMVTVDSTLGSAGVQLDQEAALMLALGAEDAINLDGGGSTVMALATGTNVAIVNRLRDGADPCDYPLTGGNLACERYVGTALAIGIFNPTAAPAKSGETSQ